MNTVYMAGVNAYVSTLLDKMVELPDKLTGYMTLRHSISIFNGWVLEQQNISPLYLYRIIQMFLINRAGRKRGLFIQGSSIFSPAMVECLATHFQTRILVVDESLLNLAQLEDIITTPTNLFVIIHSSRSMANVFHRDMKDWLYEFTCMTSSDVLKGTYGHVHPGIFTINGPYKLGIIDFISNMENPHIWPMQPIEAHYGTRDIYVNTFSTIPATWRLEHDTSNNDCEGLVNQLPIADVISWYEERFRSYAEDCALEMEVAIIIAGKISRGG
jgi:hypothetical protein